MTEEYRDHKIEGFTMYVATYRERNEIHGLPPQYVFYAIDDQKAEELAQIFAKTKTEKGVPTTLTNLIALKIQHRKIELNPNLEVKANVGIFEHIEFSSMDHFRF